MNTPYDDTTLNQLMATLESCDSTIPRITHELSPNDQRFLNSHSIDDIAPPSQEQTAGQTLFNSLLISTVSSLAAGSISNLITSSLSGNALTETENHTKNNKAKLDNCLKETASSHRENTPKNHKQEDMTLTKQDISQKQAPQNKSKIDQKGQKLNHQEIKNLVKTTSKLMELLQFSISVDFGTDLGH